MKINYKSLVAMLQEQLLYTQGELKTTMADLETEQRIQKELEDEVGRLFKANIKLNNQIGNLEYQQLQLNIDFFDLGDMLMETIKENEQKFPEQKLEDVVTGMDESILRRYEIRIDHLEGLIFELGDDIDDLKKDAEDMQADFAADWAKLRYIIKEQKREAYKNGMDMEMLKKENKELKGAIAKGFGNIVTELIDEAKGKVTA